MKKAEKELLELVKPFVEIWNKGGPNYKYEMDNYWGYDNLNKARKLIRELEK